MKSTPILFSGAMVRAIAWTKTQTRRIIHPDIAAAIVGNGDNVLHRCPYGQPGDQLWVREEHYVIGHWEPVGGVTTKGGRQKWRFVANSDAVLYVNNPPNAFRRGMHKETPDYVFWHKRLARFMPRKFARIFLEITAIRVERLKDISEADAIAEGISSRSIGTGDARSGLRPAWGLKEDDNAWASCAVQAYEHLWESINGPGSWDANPYVWVVEFQRLEVKP